MATGYTRQSAGQIVTTNTIQASDFNNEYNLLASFADGTVGHDHSGGVGLGPKIALTTAVSGILPTANGGTGVANNAASTLTISGAFATTITVTAATSVTLPTSGTLITNAVTALNSMTSASSLATIGTITVGVWNGTIVNSTYGGTGVNNAGSTITIGGNFAISGAFTTTLTVTGNTAVTLPTSGTLVTTGVTSLSSLATVGTITVGVWNGTIVTGTYGGTGVNNGASTITIGGNVTFTGAFTTALTVTGNTAVTLPTSGTLCTTVGSSSIVTVGTISSGVWNGTIITSGFGGTGNGFTKFSGPAAAEKTFTLPNASATILTDNAAVTVAQGGTGRATLTLNNVILGNGTTAVQLIAPGTSGNVLTSDGTTWASTAPTSGKTYISSSNYTTNTTFSTAIPADNSIPQVTEGTEMFSVSYTAHNASSVLYFTWDVWGGLDGGASQYICTALFKDGAANAVAAKGTLGTGGSNDAMLAGSYSVSAGDTSAHTWSLRVGVNTGNFFPNGTAGATRLYGGAGECRFTIIEITP